MRGIDSGAAARVISDETDEDKIHRIGCAEELPSENGAGEGSFCGAGEDPDQAKAGKKGDRRSQRNGEGVTEGCTDVKQRRDFAAFESAREGNGGEE